MIHKIVLKNFKRHNEKEIILKPNITLLVGGNNEGKSTILHALAVWEFCKTHIIINKGKKGLLNRHNIAGVGMSIDDFTPINIPELKYLWTNLKPSSGYNLTIKCFWRIFDEEKFIEFGLALANDRLFIKTTNSNISEEINIPSIAYIPPFAGITDKEIWHYPAQRKRLIGQGLAGSVLRNVIIDMYNNNLNKRRELKGERTKITSRDLTELRKTDPYELLNNTLSKTFGCQIYPKYFDPSFHQYISMELRKGNIENEKFKPYPNYKSRDIMVEGSGFLQWLSVYTYALNDGIDILLLDEPDAHLHCSLQNTLFRQLKEISIIKNKQILIATHSTDIIRNAAFETIMDVNKGRCKYLNTPTQKVKLLSGLGTEFSPILHEVVQTKRLLFVENESDISFLKIYATVLGKVWPSNLTVWPTATKHNERNHVIEAIKVDVEDLIAISLNDRDKHEYNDIRQDLTIGAMNDKGNPVKYARFRTWRRSEIENYMLCKSVMARVVGKTENEIDTFFHNKGLISPSLELFVVSEMGDQNKPFFELSGKEYIESFCNEFSINKHDIVMEFTNNEVPHDITTLLDEIIEICSIQHP